MSPILLTFNILPFYYENPVLNVTGFSLRDFCLGEWFLMFWRIVG